MWAELPAPPPMPLLATWEADDDTDRDWSPPIIIVRMIPVNPPNAKVTRCETQGR